MVGRRAGANSDGNLMDMLIVESNAKSKTIQKYLGRGWIVAACNGHVQDLPTSRDTKDGKKAMWASTVDKLPDHPWEWTDVKAQRTIGKLLTRAKDQNVENVYIATDPDREGEFIAWRLEEIFRGAGHDNIWRVTFNEITKPAVQASIDARGSVNLNLVSAAKVRRYMDRLVGFRASKFSRSWSLPAMGRVQTPTLGFVVERELAREAFVPQPYFSVHADAGGVRWNARFHDKTDSEAWIDDKGKFHGDRTNDESLAQSAHGAAGAGLTLASAEPGKYQRKPSPPFTTDTLLMAAGSDMGWNPRRTMKIAGELYNAGHITYIRTDSTRTNAGARDEVKVHIRSTWGEDHVGEGVVGPDTKKKGSGNVQDAHEAIRPTKPDAPSPDDLSTEQARLYRLVWARFAGSQMTSSRYERLSMTATAIGFDRTFNGTSSWRVHRGWEAAFEGIRKEPAIAPPEFDTQTGTALTLDSVKADSETENPCFRQDETKPPGRYKQHALVQQMKAEGIGRPSTYAATIDKLLRRKYMEDESGSLLPTEAGRTLWVEVAPHYDRNGNGGQGHLFSTGFTAEMEESLDGIEIGTTAAPLAWHTFAEHFQALHQVALEKKKLSPTPKQVAFFERLAANMTEEEVNGYTGGKETAALSGSEMRDILDRITKDRPPESQPASEKQVSWIASLAEGIGLSEADACAHVECAAFSELTGGRAGTASKLIETLLPLSANIPRDASEKQLVWIGKLAVKAELSEADACALVGCKAWSELTGGRGGTASDLITALRKQAGIGKGRGKGRGKGKKGKAKDD